MSVFDENFSDDNLSNLENMDIDENELDSAPVVNEVSTENDNIPAKEVKKKTRTAQPKLNSDRLKGSRGLIILEDWFKDIKFRGKGHEHEDLNVFMARLEQWTHRLFPKFTFDDSIKRLEVLGHKKDVTNYVHRIRLGMEEKPSEVVEESNVEEMVSQSNNVEDPFNMLINNATQENISNSIPTPKNTTSITITEEQKQRINRNKLLAEEKRQARLKARQSQQNLENSGIPS